MKPILIALMVVVMGCGDQREDAPRGQQWIVRDAAPHECLIRPEYDSTVVQGVVVGDSVVVKVKWIAGRRGARPTGWQAEKDVSLFKAANGRTIKIIPIGSQNIGFTMYFDFERCKKCKVIYARKEAVKQW